MRGHVLLTYSVQRVLVKRPLVRPRARHVRAAAAQHAHRAGAARPRRGGGPLLPAAKAAQVGGDWYDAFAQADGVHGAGRRRRRRPRLGGGGRDGPAAQHAARHRRGPAAARPGPAARATSTGALGTLRMATNAHACVVARVERRRRRRRRDPDAGRTPATRRRCWPRRGRGAAARAPRPAARGRLPELRAARGHAIALAPGSTLLLYTDGLVERRGEDIDVGIDRLARRWPRQRRPAAGRSWSTGVLRRPGARRRPTTTSSCSRCGPADGGYSGAAELQGHRVVDQVVEVLPVVLEVGDQPAAGRGGPSRRRAPRAPRGRAPQPAEQRVALPVQAHLPGGQPGVAVPGASPRPARRGRRPSGGAPATATRGGGGGRRGLAAARGSRVPDRSWAPTSGRLGGLPSVTPRHRLVTRVTRRGFGPVARGLRSNRVPCRPAIASPAPSSSGWWASG